MFNLTFNLIDLMIVSTVYGVETRSARLTSEFNLPLGTDVRCDITVRKSKNSSSKNDHSLIFPISNTTNKMQLDFDVDWKLNNDQIDQDGNLMKRGTKITLKDADILISNNDAMLFVCFPDVHNPLAKKFNISRTTLVSVGFEGENFLYTVKNGQFLVGFENVDECVMYSYNSKKRELEETSHLSTKRLEIDDSWMKQNTKEGHPFEGELETKKPFLLVHYKDINTLLRGNAESVTYSINAVLANASNIVTVEGYGQRKPRTDKERTTEHELYTLTKKVLVKLYKNILEHKNPVDRNIYTKLYSMCAHAKQCLRENPMHNVDKERMEYNIKVIEEGVEDIFRHLKGACTKEDREIKEREIRESMEKNLKDFREFKENVKRELRKGRERESMEREESETSENRERELREKELRERETANRSLDIFVENHSGIPAESLEQIQSGNQNNIDEFDTIPFVSGDNVSYGEESEVDEVNTESNEQIINQTSEKDNNARNKSNRKVVKDKEQTIEETTKDTIEETIEKDNSVRNISEKDESEIKVDAVNEVDESGKKSKSLKIALIILGVLALIAILLVGWTYYSHTKKVCSKGIFEDEDQSP